MKSEGCLGHRKLLLFGLALDGYENSNVPEMLSIYVDAGETSKGLRENNSDFEIFTDPGACQFLNAPDEVR